MVVIGVPLALDRLADLVVDKFERARADDVFFVPMRVFVENLLLVNKIERVGERRQKRGGREFQMKDDGDRVGGSTLSTII